jgi:glycogen operon protein
MEVRRRHPVFRRRRWFQGREIHGSGVSDLGWFNPDGNEMTEDQWNQGFAKSIGIFFNGDEIREPDPRGERVVDDSFLLLFNAHHEPMPFTLPAGPWGEAWAAVIDTNDPQMEEESLVYKTGEEVPVEARSVVVLRRAA